MSRRFIPRSDHADVGRFHEKFGLDNTTFHDPGPRVVDHELLKFRVKFMLEELLEFMDASGFALVSDPEHPNQVKVVENPFFLGEDAAGMFDALIDLNYVSLGTAHLLGFPWDEGWDAVQEANMAKERATNETASERGGTWDVVKPEGWKAPDINAILDQYGWFTAKHTDEDTE